MAYNKVILEGRLAGDPELKTTGSGVEYCTFSVAVDRDYRKGEDKQTDFIPVKAWRGAAKFISQYFHKGDPILLDGRLEINRAVTDDGQNRSYTSVVVDKCTFTIGKKSGVNYTDESGNATAAQRPNFEEIAEKEDDDLPF